MPEITDFLVESGSLLWSFMRSGWFMLSILAIKFILPKLFNLFKRTMGR